MPVSSDVPTSWARGPSVANLAQKKGLGFGVLGFWGLGLRGLGFRVSGLGFRV